MTRSRGFPDLRMRIRRPTRRGDRGEGGGREGGEVEEVEEGGGGSWWAQLMSPRRKGPSWGQKAR